MTRRRAVTAPAAVPGVLVGAVAAYGAAPGIHFSGKTSQRRLISFTLAGAKITRLQYHIVDRCPGGKLLFVHDWGFPALPVTNSKFGGKFVARPPQKATAIISGAGSGRTVTGTLSDRTRNQKTSRFCTGKASFALSGSRLRN